MKILQILPELNVGGVETGTVDLAKYIVDQGHRSIVVSNGGALVASLEGQGSKHYKLPVHKKSLISMWRMVKQVRQIIVNEGVDIVHARSRVPAWIGYFACRRTPASFITTCHGYYQSRFFSQVMGWGKSVIAPSQVIARHMVDDFAVPAERLKIIPRSVDMDKFNLERKSEIHKGILTIAIVGRITPLKGHTYFIEAMAKVARAVPNLRVWVIGDVPPQKETYRAELLGLTRRLGLTEKVEFLGTRKDIPELLAQTDVLVLSTVTQEAFGRVILEAQAAGAAVVASGVGGVVEIIDDGQTGILVPPKDPDTMAKEIIRLFRDQSLRGQLVSQARVKLKEQFTLEKMASSTLKVYADTLQKMTILVIKISSLGDIVLIIPALKALREKFPHAKIYCLTAKSTKKVLQNCPYLDGVILYDVQQLGQGWLRLVRLSQKLRRYKFDKIIDFQNNRKSHFLSFLSFPEESYGYDRKWGMLLSAPVKDNKPGLSPVAHQFELLKPLGISLPNDHRLELWPSQRDEDHVSQLFDAEWLSGATKIIGINISASLKWQTKNWPMEHIVEICDLLSQRNIRVFLTGIAKDRRLAQQIISRSKTKPASFVGKTDVLQLAALLKRCNVYLTPDSAPLHIAAAVNVPTIALFGPTSSARHAPPAKGLTVVEKKMTCAPCYGQRCRILTHACMKEITPKEILQIIERYLGEKS